MCTPAPSRGSECPRSARQGSASSGQDEARLWQAAERDGGGTGETLLKEITIGVKHSLVPARQVVLEGPRQLLDEMLPRVQQVIRQTKARIFHGDSRAEGKIVSLFEPSAEVIRMDSAQVGARRPIRCLPLPRLFFQGVTSAEPGAIQPIPSRPRANMIHIVGDGAHCPPEGFLRTA